MTEEEEYETCLSCGRDIEGTAVRVPEGDVYHYACVEVDYPEEGVWIEEVMDLFTPEGTGKETIQFFEYLRQNPFAPIEDFDNPVEDLPEVNIYHYNHPSLKERVLRLFSPTRVNFKFNLAPWLFQAVYFGCALEREYPVYTNRDELYPRDEARLPPEDSEDDSSGDSSQGDS